MNIHADVSLLEAALIGYRISRERLNERIEAITRELDGHSIAVVSTSTGKAESKRHMSAAGRKRIAAANRQRWAKFRADKKPVVAGQASPKRKLSKAARAKLAENLKKARAARAAKRAAATS